MANLNRLKAVLADAGQTNKWLAEQLGKILSLSQNGVQTLRSQIYKLYLGYQNYSG